MALVDLVRKLLRWTVRVSLFVTGFILLVPVAEYAFSHLEFTTLHYGHRVINIRFEAATAPWGILLLGSALSGVTLMAFGVGLRGKGARELEEEAGRTGRPDLLDLGSLAGHFRDMAKVLLALDGLVVLTALVFGVTSAWLAFAPLGWIGLVATVVTLLYLLGKCKGRWQVQVKLGIIGSLLLMLVSVLFIRVNF